MFRITVVMFIQIILKLFALSTLDLTNINAAIDQESYNQSLLRGFSEKQISKSTSDIDDIPNEKWTSDAIKDIAYYLRNYKFNEWDHRYYWERKDDDETGRYATFPIPPLRSLHWEIKANCQNDFYKCITYLHSIVITSPNSRTENAVIKNESINAINTSILNILDYDCKKRQTYSSMVGLPFDDPTEKFKWDTTASYYMCWYTMLGISSLSMIGESCDNFASCYISYSSNHNYDPRANDKLPFSCAMYSFCPDPCCPMKRIESILECHNSRRNPCYLENIDADPSQRVCRMRRKHNQNFKDLISNKWNISCNCRKGFKWESEFGMCIDDDECLLGIHKCDINSQDCLNLPGTYHCLCKWGYSLDAKAMLCTKSNTTLW